MKKIILIIIFGIQIAFGQSVESKVKIVCRCNPISFYPKVENEKLIFTSVINEGYSTKLYRFIYEKIGKTWINSSKYKLDGESDFYTPEISESEVLINQSKYFYSIYSLGNSGTAYNGREKYMFVFQDVSKNNNPITIFFEKWAERNGEYSIKGQKNILPFKAFLNKCSEFVDNVFPPTNEDIDSPENFNIKWNIENSSIHKSIMDNEKNIKLNFVEYNDKSFYENTKRDYELLELKSINYLISGGFAAPIICYNIKSNKSQVIFIPDGWPNGGGWGLRSYYLKDINGDILTAESLENNIKIDLAKKIINVINKISHK